MYEDDLYQKKYAEYENCSIALLQEIEILKKIASVQNLVWNAITNREWADFEVHINAIGVLGAEFDVIDQRREALFSQFPAYHINGEERARFYAFAATFPEDLRNKLADTYRNLKIETVRVRMFNDTILNYLNSIRSTVTGFLDIAFPEHRGKLYSRGGKEIPKDIRSMVLNRHF
ncbi:MAG: hypothetical protein LBQ55_01690 [Treponema sp.]|jgi:hypothetical protein|nr:hypothetical protein [Treponema sp.]